MRHRPVRNLYFAYIQGTDLDGRLTADEALEALTGAGLIIITAREGRGRPLRYMETEKMHQCNDWPENVLRVLRQFADNQLRTGGPK